jgi:predicted dehydrogenase
MIKIPSSIHRKKMLWGIAGLGSFAETGFMPAFNLLRRAKLLAVYSSDMHRASSFAEKFGAHQHFDNYDSFLKSGIEAVYIAGANSTHFEQAKKALIAGKFVLCEKPITLTAAEAEEIHNLSQKTGRLFTINYTYRYHPFVQKAKELLENQKLGKVLFIEANFNIDFVPGTNFRYNKKLAGGGALRDLGTHLIDVFRFLLGEVAEISGYLDNIVYHADVEDFATAVIKFENGSYGNFTVSYSAKKSINSLQITGHKGTIRIDNLIGMRYSASKLTISLDGEAQKVFRKRANKLYRLLKDVNTSFIKKEQPPINSFDGLINMRLMEQLEQKCKKQQS